MTNRSARGSGGRSNRVDGVQSSRAGLLAGLHRVRRTGTVDWPVDDALLLEAGRFRDVLAGRAPSGRPLALNSIVRGFGSLEDYRLAVLESALTGHVGLDHPQLPPVPLELIPGNHQPPPDSAEWLTEMARRLEDEPELQSLWLETLARARRNPHAARIVRQVVDQTRTVIARRTVEDLGPGHDTTENRAAARVLAELLQAGYLMSARVEGVCADSEVTPSAQRTDMLQSLYRAGLDRLLGKQYLPVITPTPRDVQQRLYDEAMATGSTFLLDVAAITSGEARLGEDHLKAHGWQVQPSPAGLWLCLPPNSPGLEAAAPMSDRAADEQPLDHHLQA